MDKAYRQEFLKIKSLDPLNYCLKFLVYDLKDFKKIW